MANYLAMAAVLKPGDDVLIEHPTYELIVDVALQIGANVIRFKRDERTFALDLQAVQAALTPQTRLIVVSNLHNPSSALMDAATVRAIGSFGVRVLVDEVYLDAAYEQAPRSALSSATSSS